METMGAMPTDMPTGMPPLAVPTTMGMNPSNTTGMSSMPGMMRSSCKIDMLWNWYTIDACFISHSWQIKSRGMFAGSCIAVICLVLCLEALRRLGKEYDAFILRRARHRHFYMRGNSEVTTGDSLAKHKCENGTFEATLVPKPLENGVHPTVTTASFDQQDHILPSPEAADNGVSGETHAPPAAVIGGHGPPVLNRTEFAIPRERFDAAVPHRPSPVEQVVRALLHTLQFGVAYIIMLLAMYYNGYIIICIFIGAFLGSLIFSWEQVSLNKQNDACQVTKCCG